MIKIKPVASIVSRVGDECKITLNYEMNIPMRWILKESSLPEGLSLDGESGMIVGFYRRPCLKSTTVYLVDKDTTELACINLNFLIKKDVEPEPSQPLCIITKALPAVCCGGEYVFAIETEGGAPPIRFEVSGLPIGLTCTEQGVLTGKVHVAGGKCPVTVIVRDARGAAVERFYSLEIRNN